jgi:hypothetical protein
MDFNVLNHSNIGYLEELLLDEEGNLRVLPYIYLKDIPQDHLSQFCVEQGFYIIPTTELLVFLQEEMDGDFNNTIEIGAGHGAISRILGIRAVDNYMQDDPKIKVHYELLKQKTVPYGKHVERIDANSAVKKYKPNIVIGAYCTHLYNPAEHWREGNAYGIDEKKIIRKVKKYIHIGNEKVHGKKPILKEKKREIKAEWIKGRSQYPSSNVIWIWEKGI